MVGHDTTEVTGRQEVGSRSLRGYITAGIIILATLPAAFFCYEYVKYARLIDAKLRKGAFSATSDIYAAIPQRLITNVSDHNREHRTIVRFEEIPKVLVDAVISAED